MVDLSRRGFLFGGAAATVLPAMYTTTAGAEAAIIVDDARGMNATSVARSVDTPWAADDALISGLRDILRAASAKGPPVALACARHSMGGQTLYEGATALGFLLGRIDVEGPSKGFTVFAGARWADVIPKLDAVGLSPAAMQSNNDFGVAGAVSVNARGWSLHPGPVGETVRSFRLLLADGTLLTCSREENSELFSLVIGGYGLFGILVDIEFVAVENRYLRPHFERPAVSDLAGHFLAAADGGNVNMAYGRLAVDREKLFRDAIFVSFRHEPKPATGLPPPFTPGLLKDWQKTLFRAETGSDRGKINRWAMETQLGPAMDYAPITRNALFNAPSTALGTPAIGLTDILHEYFVPHARLADFLEAARIAILASRQDILNVTIRHVEPDGTSYLAYAPERRLGAVMLFSQEKSKAADAAMANLTETLIECALAVGGSFYLPYRLHARRDQLARAYPRLNGFVERKRHYDPKRYFATRCGMPISVEWVGCSEW